MIKIDMNYWDDDIETVYPPGECIINVYDDKTTEIAWLHVMEDWRRKGIGTSLLKEAVRMFPSAIVQPINSAADELVAKVLASTGAE